MATEVRFSFIHEIQTAHPLLLLQAEFYGTALIGEGECDNIIIKEVFVKDSFQPYQDSQRLAVTEMESQNMEGGEMGKFLGMCRDAARKATKI
jgi:hypothetical protein